MGITSRGFITFDPTVDGSKTGADYITKDSKENMELLNTQLDTLEETMDNKLKLNNESLSNVNFIENKVVQDGLINHTQTFSDDGDMTVILQVNDTEGDKTYQSYFEHSTLDVGGIRIMASDTASVIQLVVRGTQKNNYYGVGGEKPNNPIIILIKKGNSFYFSINDKQTTIIDKDFVPITKSATIGSKVKNCLVYNRALSQQEIQYNLSLLSNTKSINKINDYTLSTDTHHITTPTGVTTEERYIELLKTTCKEFTSDGGDIVVNNGIAKQKVLSGVLQGQTVKNLCSTINTSNVKDISNSIVNIDNISMMITVTCDGVKPANPDISFINKIIDINKDYILKYWVYENTLNSAVELNVGSSGINVFKTTVTIPQGFIGAKEVMVTSKADLSSSTSLIRTYFPPTLTGKISYSVALFEVGTKTSDKIVPFGLNSTQATVYNNQTNYSFVKDGTVIVLGSTATKKDTLELKEDGSSIYTQNTQNNAEGSARVDLATPVVTAIPKELCPTILTQLSNTFSFGDAVKPSKVTISVPVNKIADLETRLAQLEAVVTSTSNLSSLANYVDDEYNNSLNQM